jgi:hypothetical protein
MPLTPLSDGLSLLPVRVWQLCVGGPCLAHIFLVLCRDHKHFSGGLPDLLLWRVRAPAPDTGVPGTALAFTSSVTSPAAAAGAGDAATADRDVVRVLLGAGDRDVAATAPLSLTGADLAVGAADSDSLAWASAEGVCWEARCVEVKGPRDRLSHRQRAWIALLCDAGVDTDVCFVKEQKL